MRGTVVFLALMLTLSIVPSVLAGTNYNCFLGTVTLDGNLADWAGAEFVFVPHDKGTGPAPDDADASFDFAVLVDSDWLYVAFDINDEAINAGETNNYQDDSVEIYIDANHARTETYEDDDAQIAIGAWDIGGDVNNPVLSAGADTGTRAAVVEKAGGWIVEAAIPLSNSHWDIDTSAGNVIGFNVHFNDDDVPGGTRENKLIWSDLDVDDQSWQNPSRFADLTFVGTSAVQASDKLATTWGNLK